VAIVEQHLSPDRELNLVVDLTNDDWTIGFEGYPYHTHADLLSSSGYHGRPKEAVRDFVDDILASRRAIVIWRVNGRIRDCDVPEEVDWKRLDDGLAKYGVPGETFEVRFWNGQPAVR
jgi:hypothetical protein